MDGRNAARTATGLVLLWITALSGCLGESPARTPVADVVGPGVGDRVAFFTSGVDDARFLYNAGGLEVWGDRLVVADSGNDRVAFFDRDLEWVDEHGRRGVGPGEFQNPWSLAVPDGGALAVLECGGPPVAFMWQA